MSMVIGLCLIVIYVWWMADPYSNKAEIFLTYVGMYILALLGLISLFHLTRFISWLVF
jgi:hypothetical protein